MRRSISTIAAASLVALILAAVPARAEVIDPVDIVGGVATSVLGPRSCSASIGTPVHSGGFVRVTGSVGCTSAHTQIEVEVCLQYKPPIAFDEAWQTYACAPAARGGSSATATASAPCLPGTWDYRGILRADGFNGPGQPVWTAMMTGPQARISCPGVG